MPIFFSIKLYVFIIYILVHIEIINSTKNNIRFLFENDGWKNLTDVEYINYWSKKYTLQKTLETPVTSNTCDTRIRSATIILGCSYANVLKTIFFIMDRFLEYCETLINLDNKNKNAFDCTTEIIKIIPKLSDLATLMKGALVSVDKLHRKPMANSKRNELILNNVTTRLHIEKALNLLSPIQVNQFNTKNILETIRNYFIYLRLDLENDLRLCHLKSLNLLSLWQLLSKKYRSSKENGSNQEFWTFMSYKIKSLIHWTIIERYNNLGFKFDWNTKETFLPNTSKKFETVKWSFKNYFSNKINSLFKHSGWKNMTDVNYITYLRHNYILQDIIQNTLRYDKPIFCITLILGCSYANILKNIFFILNYFQNHCRYYSREENLINYKYNCTVQLLRTIPLLTSLVIYMGSALDALDKTDKHQTESNDLKNFISSKLVNVLQDKNVLKLLPLLQINLSNYEEALLKVLSLIVEWNEELNNGMSICNINSESLTSLWHNLNNEYHNMQLSGSNIEFYNFLRFKIMTICQWAIQEKYVNLGFKFNTDTKETLIPDLLESSEQEHFEDPIIASTQMLNGDNIEVKWSFKNYFSNKINSLFKHSGWKNMTDVNYITYLRHNYILQDIIQNTLRYDKPIFCITLILGCSYANILKNIFFILNYFQNHCRYYSREENLINYKYNCTVQLLRTIPLLTSLVIYMGSALDALDKTDKHQTESNDLKNFISSKLVNVLQDKNVLKLLPLLQINLSNYEEALLKVLSLIVEWNEELNNGMSICNINSESLTSLWHNLNNEYHNMQLSGSNIEFYNFLRFKIMTICQWAIQEKYVNLGFKFNTDTKETLIPDLLESSEQEHFEDPIIASTQMLNGDNIEEHFEDPIMASTHMLNDENIEENLNFEDTRNNHETQDKTSLLIDIPEYLRPFNKYL
ncbi:uncharacterized protein LOC126902733 isoform X3 [Daktulosphaira vitifoliae]|uniref:uncharacterized protein LOC126902733 isoform X2 n=1 Tax=Daktulosphaira vitifoliae TaxID=58002 RepID=UPI0021A9EBE3|nr:uncharacterized protein LOC126902733 isoform X2 [Daktulosphaira vitifoliae]XP_050536272.1 uncharacterized protein LOC126902733 isoform X3 [Daktulosphaira vitifoliae]